MALTRTYGGTDSLDSLFQQILTGDAAGGSQVPSLRRLRTWNNDGGAAPSFAGWLYGTLTLTGATNVLIAHATDPFAGAGDAFYSDGFTPAGKKPKLVYILSDIANTQNVTVRRGLTNGLPIFSSANVGVTLSPGGYLRWVDEGGNVVGALTTGTNDALTITPVSGTQVLTCLVVYGT